MEATDKSTVPQKGTGLAGESLAVARRPDNTGGRATGSPPYSGEGPLSLSALHTQRPPAMHNRTPTDTAQMTGNADARNKTNDPQTTTTADRRIPTDEHNLLTRRDELTVSTSGATATPVPSALLSAWTQVVPRHKRKKQKKKKKVTSNQNDNPTGVRVDRPAQGPVSDMNATSNNRARGSYGQSGVGHSLSAETVASGSVVRATADCEPGPSKGRSTDTRYEQPRTVQYANKPARHRTHPVADRLNTHWRGRSSGVTDAGSGDPGPSTSHSIQKRDRLDDTISPRGEHKRRRTDRTTHGATSYAQASRPHLNVAVALAPRANLTQTEADNLQEQVQEEIFNTCIRQSTPGNAAYAPSFEGRAFLSEGVLKLWCSDDKALDWLQMTVPKLRSPREGAELTLIKQSDIPVRIRSALFVPNYAGEVGKLHLVLTCQNPWYRVSTWTLYTFKRILGRTPGLFLVLGIPKEQIDDILARGRKVAYSTGSIYIRFFTKEGVSDVPPQETPQPDMQTKPETNITDPQLDTRSIPSIGGLSLGSPGSCASTVLEDIETVLTEDPSETPIQPPPNNLNWVETTESKGDTAALTLQELLETWAPKADL